MAVQRGLEREEGRAGGQARLVARQGRAGWRAELCGGQGWMEGLMGWQAEWGDGQDGWRAIDLRSKEIS